MILKLKRTPGLYLVGFMGSGKSTVGRALADELGWFFVDLDEEIERQQGRTISSIFDTNGELEFRRIESDALQKIVRAIQSGRPHVVALGGGAFLSEENLDLVTNHGISIWLDAPLETIERRIAAEDHRPLARDPEKLRALFEVRRPGYARADYRIEHAADDPADAGRGNPQAPAVHAVIHAARAVIHAAKVQRSHALQIFVSAALEAADPGAGRARAPSQRWAYVDVRQEAVLAFAV